MKNSLKENNLILIILILLALVLSPLKSFNIYFVLSTILIVLTLKKCKFSFFSLKSIIIYYSLFPFFFKHNFNIFYGLFSNSNTDNYLIAVIAIFIYLLCWYFIYQNTNILSFEKEKLIKKFNYSNNLCKIFAFMAVITTLVRFPTLPFLENYDRFVSLLPGNGWNHIVMILLVFSIPKLKHSKFIQFTFIFVLVWFFGHYERVDCIGLILLLLLLFFNNTKINVKKIAVCIIGIVILFLGLTSIEFIRVGSNFDFRTLVSKIFVNSTASDVDYTYDRAIEYSNKKLEYGKTYLKYVVETIPMIDYKDSSELILNRNYRTVGGEFILNEPIMNFGFSGIIVFFIVEFLIIYNILKMNNSYSVYFLYVLTFSVFRIVWYGISYVETALLWYVPLLLLFVKVYNKIEKVIKK